MESLSVSMQRIIEKFFRKKTFVPFSPKLRMWFVEAQKEVGRWREGDEICTDYALYPRSFYKRVADFDHDKRFDFCFIGGFKTDAETEKNRAWILEFIRRNFTDQSYLQFTDQCTKQGYDPMGKFDYTLERSGFVPKEHRLEDRNRFDENYFRMMSQSQFTLCPAGDAFWSMRFYEALMCRSIPIVKCAEETYRSEQEKHLGYKYYLTSNQIVYREDWAEHNYQLFLKYHTLDDLWKL